MSTAFARRWIVRLVVAMLVAAVVGQARAEEIRGPVPPKDRWKERLLIVPRILLFPLRALFWGFSYPTQAGTEFDDRHQIHDHIYSALTWDEDLIGIRPAFSYSLKQTPSVGISFFDHRSMGHGTALNSNFLIGGASVIHTETHVLPIPEWRPVRPMFDIVYDRRNDRLYTGIGNKAPQPAGALGFARYSGDYLDLRAGARLRALRWLDFSVGGWYGYKRFDNGEQSGAEPPINQVYCTRIDGRCTMEVDPALVPGFQQGTQFLRAWAGVRIDTRQPHSYPRTGLLFDADADYSHGLAGDRSSYFRLHGSLGVAIDLWQRARTLLLRVAVSDVAPLDNRVVPFSELAVLGSANDLRGFRMEQFRDFSSLLMTAEYRWPVWMWLDAALFADYGGVAGQWWKNIGAGQLQPDVGGGLRFHASSGFVMRVDLAYGFGSGIMLYLAGGGP